jgi:hypothetical protein
MADADKKKDGWVTLTFSILNAEQTDFFIQGGKREKALVVHAVAEDLGRLMALLANGQHPRFVAIGHEALRVMGDSGTRLCERLMREYASMKLMDDPDLSDIDKVGVSTILAKAKGES